jgi:hypothetical protein
MVILDSRVALVRRLAVVQTPSGAAHEGL